MIFAFLGGTGVSQADSASEPPSASSDSSACSDELVEESVFDASSLSGDYVTSSGLETVGSVLVLGFVVCVATGPGGFLIASIRGNSPNLEPQLSRVRKMMVEKVVGQMFHG
eukprot:g81902.t1